MVTQYSAGANIERTIKQKYEAQGYYVIRSAGSHGLADLVIITPSESRLVQVKSYKDKMPKYETLKEYEELRQLQVPKNVHKQILLYKRGKGIHKIVEIGKDRVHDRITYLEGVADNL